MDISGAIELVKREAYSVTAQLEPNTDSLIPILCDIRTLSPDGSSGFGDKESMVGELGELEETEEGESYPEDDFKIPWTARIKFLRFAKRLRIHEGHYNAVNAEGKIGNLVASRLQSWALNWRDQKERRLINTYEKGVLTAGSLPYFNGTFEGEVDPNPKFIYDGQPLFDTTHPLGYDASQTKSNHNAALAFSAANLKTVDVQFRKAIAVTDRGRAYNHTPTHILAPMDLRHSVMTTLQSSLLPGSANNDVNTLQGSLIPVFSNHFTSATCWAVLRAKYGMRAYDSGDIRANIWFDDDKKDIVVDVDGRCAFMVTNWRHGIMSNLAAA